RVLGELEFPPLGFLQTALTVVIRNGDVDNAKAELTTVPAVELIRLRPTGCRTVGSVVNGDDDMARLRGHGKPAYVPHPNRCQGCEGIHQLGAGSRILLEIREHLVADLGVVLAERLE